ncbi:MAG: tRNA (N6-isopentenyl adenosine(37)-C2)-methylthiotransferase MiaB [Nitrospirae bacterium]|nr:MAG: tRNA (N6-isopentenyl adenosine(37)-C2)-methylthiotransferase MiaB [Nitrospirota bacterium]
MEKLVFIYTYGCQMNVHDSEKIRGVLSEKGYKTAETPEEADLIVFNTCAIRAKAEQKFYSQLGRIKFLKQANKDLKIAVAGCAAQDAKQKIFRRAPYVDYVIGPRNIQSLPELLLDSRGLFVTENPEIAEQEFPAQRDSATKAWITIMYGCNNFCTYCIVPYTRGREVSRPSNSILAEIGQLVNKGYREVTLLGQNVNSYRSDTDFPGLLRLIDRSGIHRVRFVTSHPRDLSADLIKALSDLPSLCEHIHLPLQSGSDKILSAMNRRYTYADYLARVTGLRNSVPGISITTDVIVGFPGETEEDYELTVRALQEIEFDGLFAFKYSRRNGTRAGELDDQLSEEQKNDRLNRLLPLQEEITLRKNRLLEGLVLEVMVEGPSDSDPSRLTGRTRSNKIVTIPDSGEEEGALVRVEIRLARPHSLEGVRADLVPAPV